MAFKIDGPKSWSLSIDQEGYRTYKLAIRVVSDDSHDGPGTALLTPGLPLVGSLWSGYETVDDLWCWCQPTASANPVSTSGGNTAFDCDFTFSNKPAPANKRRCQDFKIEDPLLEPQKMSLHFAKSREEATVDRFGSKLLTSSHEQIRGPQVEFEEMSPSVKIEQNVPQLQPELLSYVAANPLNDSPLWGLPARCVKLSEISVEEKFMGACEYYFTRHFGFEVKVKINPETGEVTSGWDRDVLDEGTKVLRGHWNEVTGGWDLDEVGGAPPNPFNPTHFIRYQDKNGNTARVLLDGAGKPYVPTNVTTTDDCDQCPDPPGAPATYQLTGFTGVVSGVVPLSIQSDCRWVGLGDDSTTFYTLKYNDPDASPPPSISGKWTLTRSEGGGLWLLDPDVTPWACWGNNILTKNSGDGPAFVFVAPQSASEPAKRHIEKYGESNLLLLGIPLVLGLPTPP